MKKTFADLFAETIKGIGVTEVFVYPGGTIAPLINAFVKLDVKIEVFKHEQGAVFAAMAKARITGSLQVALVTSGPGLTNALTPLADAFYDSTPLFLVSGQVGTADLASRQGVRQRGFQEVPTSSIVKSICKAVACPFSVHDAVSDMNYLLNEATNGRWGPVVFDLPMNIQREELEYSSFDSSNSEQALAISNDAITRVISLLKSSTRTVVLLGHGAHQGDIYKKIHSFIDAINAIVVTSLPGLGSFSTRSEKYFGYIGHTGHEVANLAVHESDLLIVLGARLDLRQTGTQVNDFVPNGNVIWVNNDQAELDEPRVKIDTAINSSINNFLDKIMPFIKNDSFLHDNSWLQKLHDIRVSDVEDHYDKSCTKKIYPKQILSKLNELIWDQEGFVVTGVGSHQQWAARHIDYSPNTLKFLTSAGHGTMGYDLPSAIGAAMTYPEKQVYCIVGDGSLLMNIQELASLKERDLNVKVILLNNNRLGIVSQFQQVTWGADPSTGCFSTPDFTKIAEGFGIKSSLVSSPSLLNEELKRAVANEGPYLLEIAIDHDSNVEPMLLAGHSMNDMWKDLDNV